MPEEFFNDDVMAMCSVLITDLDRISLENYISLLELTYIEWERRNLLKPPPMKRAYRFAA
jgi:hypothetical protein